MTTTMTDAAGNTFKFVKLSETQVSVLLEGKRAGTILFTAAGWRYIPKGQDVKDAEGDAFPTWEACRDDVVGPQQPAPSFVEQVEQTMAGSVPPQSPMTSRPSTTGQSQSAPTRRSSRPSRPRSSQTTPGSRSTSGSPTRTAHSSRSRSLTRPTRPASPPGTSSTSRAPPRPATESSPGITPAPEPALRSRHCRPTPRSQHRGPLRSFPAQDPAGRSVWRVAEANAAGDRFASGAR